MQRFTFTRKSLPFLKYSDQLLFDKPEFDYYLEIPVRFFKSLYFVSPDITKLYFAQKT